jgi:HPt (histidine-containing phosphotransfer) domain-containing protein
MGQTALRAPEEAQVGDGEKSQVAGMDDHRAKAVTRECRVTVQPWSRGNECEDRVADERVVLDPQVLATLQELEQRSRAGLLARLITLYLQEVPAQLAALHEAVPHRDAARVEEVAHGLRGNSAQLGATRMTRLCTALQEDAGTHNLSRAVAQVADLTREFSRVQAALEAVLQQTQPP